MAQLLKDLATKPEDPGSISRTHVVAGESCPPKRSKVDDACSGHMKQGPHLKGSAVTNEVTAGGRIMASEEANQGISISHCPVSSTREHCWKSVGKVTKPRPSTTNACLVKVFPLQGDRVSSGLRSPVSLPARVPSSVCFLPCSTRQRSVSYQASVLQKSSCSNRGMVSAGSSQS